MKYIIAIVSLLFGSMVLAQSQTKRVLFLGNSYTYVNDLPQMIADVAGSVGDTLIFDSNTPGGMSLYGHFTSQPASISKIEEANWDYVVLQEQSQLPSFPIDQVEEDVFPYAHKLDSIINIYNPCGETVFYMTWGRKNGDASNCSWWPPVCTYDGMDSLLNLRYRMMADSNNAILSPVGAVWHYIRQNFPLIELYQPDESHPSVAGTYAAACCFYSALYRKNPMLISFNSTISAIDAANIRNAAKLLVYDSLIEWHIGEYDPFAEYSFFVSGINQITFTNSSANTSAYTWDFGDGATSSALNPIHTYAVAGSYTVTLIAGQCGLQDTVIQTINTNISGIQPPAQNLWSIYTDRANSLIVVAMSSTGSLNYKIYNVIGAEIERGKVNDLNKKIDIATLSDGLYFIRLFHNNNSLGQKGFIKP